MPLAVEQAASIFFVYENNACKNRKKESIIHRILVTNRDDCMQLFYVSAKGSSDDSCGLAVFSF